MKRLAILMFSATCLVAQAQAQTYTQHIQQKTTNKGTVKITQSKEIDDLVNGTSLKNAATPTTQDKVAQAKNTPATPTQKTVTQKPATPTQRKEKADTNHYIGQPRHHDADPSSAEREKALKEKGNEAAREAERKRAEAANAQETEGEMSIPTVDMRKKVMRSARKITGYRVQAFAGGNTREDKQRAQQIGDAIKMKHPDQPVYVHFYTPRWICRVGNYRTYAEAANMLNAVKKMGYKGATIVKGKITVFE